jgi:hypothetical protein
MHSVPARRVIFVALNRYKLIDTNSPKITYWF